MATHSFGEKREEWSSKKNCSIPVWQTSKFEASKAKAIEIIDSGKYGIEDSDFWILMNETKGGKMQYTGLIIAHTACLKINDALEQKFKPECVSVDKSGYGGSLVYTYCCPEQGLYEVGEASSSNCKNAYPYAMAYKRLFDRVVLKLSKLAYSGVYSEAESDEFREPQEITIEQPTVEDAQKLIDHVANNLAGTEKATEQQKAQITTLMKSKHVAWAEIAARYHIKSSDEMTCVIAERCIKDLKNTVARV